MTLTLNLTLGKKMQGGVECLYELNLLHHVGVVAKRLCAAAETAAEKAAHEGDDNTPSGPTGRGVKMAVVTPIIMEQPSYPLGELDTFL